MFKVENTDCELRKKIVLELKNQAAQSLWSGNEMTCKHFTYSMQTRELQSIHYMSNTTKMCE